MKGIVVVARTRTGTNWLREMLAACTTGQNLGEVLRPDERHDGNFFSWFDTVHGTLPAHRGRVWVADVLSAYLDHAETTYPVPILDLKYSSFSAFDATWRSPLDLPILLRLLLDRGYKVIHQRRDSLLDTSVSEAVAAITGVYTSHAEPVRMAPLQLNVKDVVRLGLEYRDELGLVRQMLAGRKRVVELSYEAILAGQNNGTLQDLLRSLVADTDLTFRGLRPVGIRQLLPDWRTTVVNAAEVEAAARQAGLC